MAVARTPGETWIGEGLRALAAGGPEAVRVEAMARALGTTKGSFYWHFDGRRALLDAVLDAWEQRTVDEVIDRVEEGGGDARAKLRRLFGLAKLGGVGGLRGRDILRIDLAVRDWARRDRAVARRLRRVDNRRMGYMRSLFAAICDDEEEVEARCLLAFSVWIGNHFIAADHGARSRAEVLELALKRLAS